jgi:zinc protease
VNLNLRERHGWTYGAFSFLNDNRGPGPFVVGAQVRGDATGPAIGEILNEVRALRDAPIAAAELHLAKESIARSLPAMFETTRSAVGTIGGLHLFDLPADFYAGLPSRIASLTEADVLEVARGFLKPEEMRVVVVGDRAQVEPQLVALGLGALDLRDAEAQPLGT